MTNDVPFTMLATGTDKNPCTPPAVLQVRNILLEDVTAVVDTVTVPATSVAVPSDAFVPVAIFSLFPEVVSDRFPVTSS